MTEVVPSPGQDALPLDQRSLEVLRIVVKEHVRSGEPVSSKQVARLHPEQLSPATIRNIMADLTDHGYLDQPHTSAGRVPADRGYRSFVDEVLAAERHLAPDEARRIEDILVSSRQAEDLLGRAGELLGRLANQVAVVVTPDIAGAVIEYVDFVRVAPQRIVAIFVGRGGLVLHRVVDVEEDLAQDELDRAGARIREQLAGMTLLDARGRLVASLCEDQQWAGRLGREASGAILRLLEEPFVHTASDVVAYGTSRLLDVPEFADVQRLRDVLRTIEEKSRLVKLLDRCLVAPGVQVIIGSEARDPGMAPIALVASPYSAGSAAQGLVAVLGPRRMEYARAVALVDHFARTLSGLLTPGGQGTRTEEP